MITNHVSLINSMKTTNLFNLLGIILVSPYAIKALPLVSNLAKSSSDPTPKICLQNANMGWQANPRISAECSSLLNLAIGPEITCIQIPPKPGIRKIEDLDSFLSHGMQTMNDQLERYISRNSKLKRAIFIMGNSDSGKTTLAGILTGNLNHLHATYTINGTLEIVENKHRISENREGMSNNLIPKYLVNPENKVGFWDCPNFDDSLDAEIDIAKKYFLQKSLDFTSTAKFIITVGYSAVKKDNDGMEFDLLANNVVRLLKNLQRFDKSISIVVTKVDNYQANGEYNSDKFILNEIHQFLKLYLSTQINKLKSEGNLAKRLDLKLKNRLMESILESKPGHSAPVKLYFLRNPDKCGPLRAITSIVKARHQITEMYEDRLIYASVAPEDFKFTFKPEFYQKLEKEFIPSTLVKVEKIVAFIASDMSTRFKKIFYETLDESLQRSLQMLNRTNTILDAIKDVVLGNSITNSNNPTQRFLSKQVENVYQEMGLDMKCSYILTFFELENRIDFFVKLSNRRDLLSRLFSICYKTSLKFYNMLGDATEFYSYCNTTKYELVEYSKQNQLSILLNDTKADDINSDAQIIEWISKNNLTSTSPFSLSSWKETTQKERKYLANIIRSVLPKNEFKCVKSSVNVAKMHLMVFGNNFKLSDLMDKSTWPTLCKGKNNISEISVLALERVYIDTDINSTVNEKEIGGFSLRNNFKEIEEFNIHIIAPIWKVIGKRKLVLDGVLPLNLPQVQSVNRADENGKNGKDGYPGGNAGSFLGIYSNIENENSLYISANGGNGGNGQMGGNGDIGRRGNRAEDYNTWGPSVKSYNFDRCHPRLEGFEFGLKGAKRRLGEYGELVDKCVSGNKTTSGEYYTRLGGTGGDGWNGGNGGNSGLPGRQGKIEIFHLNENDVSRIKIEMSSKEGLCGNPGLGGLGGIGGFSGDYYACKLFNYWDVGSCSYYTDNFNSGKNGSSGNIGKGCSTNKNNIVSKFEPWRVINEYKTHFFEDSSQIFREFVEKLDTNKEIGAKMSVISFAVELNKLEEKVFKMGNVLGSKQNAYQTYYENFLIRLKNYTETFVLAREISEQDRIALNIIYGTVLSKMVSFRISGNQLNVIKTKEYFDSLIIQMNSLEASKRQLAIQRESEIFGNKLSEKIKEAGQLLKTTVIPAIDNSFDELENTNKNLVHEINEYLEAAKNDVEKKNKTVKQMESARTIDIIFGVVNTVTTITSLLLTLVPGVGLAAPAVGLAANVGLGLLKNAVESPTISEQDKKPLELPAGFQNSLSGLQNDQYFKNQIDFLEKQNQMVLEAADKVTGNVLQEVRTIANFTKTDLESIEKSISAKNGQLGVRDISKLNQAEKSMNEMIKTVVQFEKDTVNIDTNDNDILQGLAFGLKAAKPVLQLVKTIINGTSNIEKMKGLVKDAESNVKAVESKRDQFYSEIFPTLNSIDEIITKVTIGLPGESQVALSVKKWKIKGILKNMRGFIIQFTQAMKVTETFQRGFDTLDEALTVMIELYNHIEKYEEKKELASFIANVNSANDLAKIKDNELRGTLTSLDFFINANLFVEEYQKGVHAFKQWAFPFANRYLNEPTVEKQIQNLTEMKTSYINKIKGLSLALNKYAATTVQSDEYTKVSQFTSNYKSSEPFYKWSNVNWQVSIKKLLAGHPIHLKSDVNMIDQDNPAFFRTKSAIKFKDLVLVLKTQNASRQNELDQLLDHFHMTMKHSGISMYKVTGNHFVMYDRSIRYTYSFEKTVENRHVTVNEVKYKVDGPGADFLMSPYTWWTFQISDAKVGGIGFQNLEEFDEEVDLELEGNGVYLEEEGISATNLEDLKLTDFYEVYESTKKWVFNEEVNQDVCILTRRDMVQKNSRVDKVLLRNNNRMDRTNILNADNKENEDVSIGSIVNIMVLVVVVTLLVFLLGCYSNQKYFVECLSMLEKEGGDNRNVEFEMKNSNPEK